MYVDVDACRMSNCEMWFYDMSDLRRHLIICILFSISCISVVHEGCGTMKCGSTTCRNYDGTCDGGRILEKIER